MAVKPEKFRHTIVDLGNTLRITIPAERSGLFLLAIPLWLAGWIVVSIATLIVCFSQGIWILLVWQALWVFFGFLVFRNYCWIRNGKEIIEISRDAMIVRYQAFGLNAVQEYPAKQIKNLRMNYNGYHGYSRHLVKFAGYGLACEKGGQYYRFAGGLDRAEAELILQEITERFPQYGTKKQRRLYRKRGKSSGCHPAKSLNTGQASSG